MIDKIEQIEAEGLKAIDDATTSDQLEELRIKLLGRKAELPNLLRGVAELPPEQRGAVGKRANGARQTLEAKIDAAKSSLGSAELDKRLAEDRVDVTLPGSPVQAVGRRHLITQ